MYTPWDFTSADDRRLSRTRRPGRKLAGYRRLGIEQLEDRRVLSGLSLVVPSNPCGPFSPAISTPAVSLHTGSTQGGAALTSAQLAAETTVGQSINSFAEGLYQQIQSQAGGSGNLFLSPASISTALAMTYAGARGATASQMAAALHYTLDANTLSGDFGSLLADLNSAGQGNYSLSVADALWGQQGYAFLTPFLNLVQADYGGGLQQLDFANATEAARQTINHWVAQETNNKIQDLIPQGALTQLTKLVLTNAIYFKGNWATPFNASLTQNAAFTLSSGSQVQVPTMHNTDSYGYMQSNGYQVVELPYAGNRLVMDVLLPSAGSGLSSLDASQLPTDLNAWLQGLTSQKVAVSLPKFQITTPSFDLTSSLEALGMTDAFNSRVADFSGISANPLNISAVMHKAFIDVNENGTEAAAATAVATVCHYVAMPDTPPVVFNADHPFLFVIRDTQSGSVLFMGQVADPSSTSTDPSAPAVSKLQAAPAAAVGPTITLFRGSGSITTITPSDSITSADGPYTGFILSGAPVGATYSYTVTSSGGGTPLTGTGIVNSTTPQYVTGINIASLHNGILTFTVKVANEPGGSAEFTATTTLDQTAPTGYTIQGPGTVTATDATATGFSFSNAEDGTTYSYTVTSSGGGAPVTGTGTVTTTAKFATPKYPGALCSGLAWSVQEVTRIDVSSLPDGILTFTVTLTNGAGTGVPVTATATLARSSSSAPVVLTSAPAAASASVGHAYTCQINTIAIAGKMITYSLIAAPAGMTINAMTGLVSWTPGVLQTGSNAVTVVATDQFGNTGRQIFSVSVSGTSTPKNPFAAEKLSLLTVFGPRPVSVKTNVANPFLR